MVLAVRDHPRTQRWNGEPRIPSILHDRGITLVIVSHRLSAIAAADKVIVLHEGRIACKGKHDELARTCRVYQKLIERQVIRAE